MNRFPIGKITLLMAVLAISSSIAFAQSAGDYSVAFGLSTSRILGNNPGALSFSATGEGEDALYGGSFGDAQPGIEFRTTFMLDDEGDFRIPIGVDYQFLTAKERLPLSSVYEQRYMHSVRIVSPYTGIHFVFLKFPLAESKVYGGFEVRASYLHDMQIRLETINFDDPERNEIYEAGTKDEVWRIGGLLRVGIEGTIIDDYQVNLSVGYSLTNIMGRDDERGELLTPFARFDTGESILSNFHFSLLLQYAFRN